MNTLIITWLAIGVVVLFVAASIRIIRPTSRGAIETLGRYTSYAQPGFHFVIPFVQRLVTVTVTEQMTVVEPQVIITQDNLNAVVDLVVYYKVKPEEESIKKSIYNVEDFRLQIISLAQTTARNVIGGMVFTDVNSERNKLNKALEEVLDKESESWGVQIVRVELKEITPPQDVQETMNSIIKAENTKKAAVDFATAAETEADGRRRASIKTAEGERQARILEAEGLKKSLVLRAEGESKAIELVNTAANKYFVGNAQELKRIEEAREALKNGTKYVIDTDKDVTTVFSEAAGITPLPRPAKKPGK